MTLTPGSMAATSGRHPWWTLLGWVVVLVGAFLLSITLVPDALDGEDGPTQTLEYEKALNLVNERFGPLDEAESGEGEEQSGPDSGGRPTLTEFFLISSESSIPGDPAFDDRVHEFGGELATAQENAGVQIIVGDFSGYEGQVSEDGTTLLTTVQVYEDQEDEIRVLMELAEEATHASDGFQFLMLGDASINATFMELAEEDLVVGEMIGIGVAIIILALVFGAVVAAFIPIILAIAAVFTAVGLTGIIGQFVELNEFVPNIITMMGLAVGIDYSLFVLSRYREERARGLSKEHAIDVSGHTAGRAVAFSGMTVVLALLGMLLIPERTFMAFGIGSITVVFVAVMTSMTLLPALIGILGDRVNSVRAPLPLTLGLFIVGTVIVALTVGLGPIVILVSFGVMALLAILNLVRRFVGKGDAVTANGGNGGSDEGGVWNSITLAVMKRPMVSMIAAGGFLVILSYFFFELDKGTSGISVLPDEEPAKEAFQLLDDKFGFGSDAPARVVIDGDVGSPAIANAISALEALMAADSGVQAPEVRIEPSVELASLTAKVPGDPSNQDALNTIRRIRNDHVPEAFAGVPDSAYEVYVGGDTASIVDSVKITDEYMPIVFGAVLSLSFILLLFAFRSITVSIASIIMNLLSVGAAYGLVVLVFQKGFLIDLFGFEQVDQVEFWLPLFMFSILFGLSMDYHVFMLSRIKERFDETKDAAESVAFGLRTTASIITGAALIMVAVFGGFALGQIAFFQSMGFGLGAAVLLDATVVRSLLVPSVMRMLGDRAWYFPSWLEWMPNISIEGATDDRVPDAVPAGGGD